jgi:hypothetical protein
VSALRLQSLLVFAKSENVTWEFYDISLWSILEIGTGIMCACLPAIYALLIRFFPVISGSRHSNKYKSKSGYFNHGGGPLSNPSAAVDHYAYGAHVAVVSKRSDGSDSSTGIHFQKSYVVEISNSDREGDETSLVPLSNLRPPAKTWQTDY